MIFPTGYDEDYEYREDIMKPNQAVDPRRQPKQQPTNHDRTAASVGKTSSNVYPSSSAIVNGNGIHLSHGKQTSGTHLQPINQMNNSSSFDSTNYKFDRSESQYAGLVESQL